MKLNETSKEYYERKMGESPSVKFKKSLESVRVACDRIVAAKGEINYARVSHFTNGSPAKQSIYNSKKLRLYIDLRRNEYDLVMRRHGRSEKSAATAGNQSSHLYPVSGLDLKTKKAFDNLEKRNTFLEKVVDTLEKQLRSATEKNPLDFAEAITQGPDADLNMDFHQANRNGGEIVNREFQEAIKKLFDFAQRQKGVNIYEVKGKKVLAQEKSVGRDVILGHTQLVEIEKFF